MLNVVENFHLFGTVMEELIGTARAGDIILGMATRLAL
jgi:hypothetical protein